MFNLKAKRDSLERYWFSRAAQLVDNLPSTPGQDESISILLEQLIPGLLVGLETETLGYLGRFRDALRAIVGSDEVSPFREMCRRRDLALLCWLTENRTEAALFEDAALFSARLLESRPVRHPDDAGPPDASLALGYHLSNCLQAGAYRQGYEDYQRWSGAASPDPAGLANPAVLESDVDFGVWACRYRHGRAGVGDDFVAAGEAMLRRNLDASWLARGRATIASHWLKIIYWDTGRTAEPLETLLSAYDLMPDAVRPMWLRPPIPVLEPEEPGGDQIVVPSPAAGFAEIAAALTRLGYRRDPDTVPDNASFSVPVEDAVQEPAFATSQEPAFATSQEPAFASWSGPPGDDGEADWHAALAIGLRWLLLRGDRARARAAALVRAVGGHHAGTASEALADLLAPGRTDAGVVPIRGAASRWLCLRWGLAELGAIDRRLAETLFRTGLADPDWRVRLTAMVGAARAGCADLAPAVAGLQIPEAGPDGGLESEDRRILLALRAAAVDLLTDGAGSKPGKSPRSSADSTIAARRKDYQRRARAMLAGTAEPPALFGARDRTTLLFTALTNPDRLPDRDRCPSWWQGWLRDAAG